MRDEKETVLSESLDASSTSSLIPPPSSFSFRLFLLFLVLGFAAYSAILNSYFLSDDFVQIGKVLGGDWSLSWGREHGGFFRPLFILSYIADSLVWERNPFGYHLTNVALHALSSFLIYCLALCLLRRQEPDEAQARLVSLAAGLLFLLHPSHTEAVSWISGRADLLAALFCLASLLAYISYVDGRRTLHLLLACLSFAFALLSKESAASLPLILFAVGLYFAPDESRKDALRRAMKMSTPFLLILLLFILARRAALGTWLGGYGAEQHLNFSPGWIRDRFLQACVRSLLPAFPQELSSVMLKPLKSTGFILFALAFVCLIILLLRRRRKVEDVSARREQNRLIVLVAAAFVLSLLPVINLRISPLNTQGERFIYWPTAFASVLVAYLSFILLRGRRRRWWLPAVVCLLVFYSVSLYRTNRTWREAAEISSSIKDELTRAASPGRSMIVINAPDNLQGVPLYHNGLQEALTAFQKEKRIERVHVLALHDIQAPGDEVELKSEDGALTLRLLNSEAGFTQIANSPPCLETLERNNQSLRFRLRACNETSDLFIFNAGKMYRVLDVQGRK